MDLLLTANDTVFVEESPLQGIFPTLRFTCNGNITQLLYRASAGGSDRERFEFWRISNENPENSNALMYVPTRADEVLNRSISANAHLYSVNVNIPIQANDFLGITKLVPGTLHFQNVNESSYYYREFLASSFNARGERARPIRPLITALISRKLLMFVIRRIQFHM